MLIKDDTTHLAACAELYAAAYAGEPWNETLEPEAVQRYLQCYIDRPGLHMYCLLHDGVPAGVALCGIVPAIGSDFARIEDFCIALQYQRLGLGQRFMQLLFDDLRACGCDSALLATQRDFPSHRFYLKNGFAALDTSVQLFREF